MTRPAVSATTEEMYAALGPANTTPDEATDWTLLAWISGVGELHHDVATLVRHQPDRVGWEILLDPVRCPDRYLPWLAQFNGVRLRDGLTATQQRQAIIDRPARRRGTVTTFTSTVRSFLTGSQRVELDERWTGNPHLIRVRYYASQAPDPIAVDLAIHAAVSRNAAGIRAVIEVLAGQTWDDLMAKYATWDEVIAAYPTWDALLEDI